MRYKVITENVTNAYQINKTMKQFPYRPDKGFESLERLIEYVNKYIEWSGAYLKDYAKENGISVNNNSLYDDL